jgi:SAM-dependent methyltransferase
MSFCNTTSFLLLDTVVHCDIKSNTFTNLRWARSAWKATTTHCRGLGDSRSQSLTTRRAYGRWRRRLGDPSLERSTMPPWDIRHIALCEAKGIPVPKDARILDFGCGAGRRVYELLDAGYPYAAGYDVVDYLALRDPADRARFHIGPSGHVPVPEATFDFVFSDQVFEHVLDQPTAFREIVRILTPGGVSVHVIPAKWQLIEAHMKVPLGGLRPFKRISWYLPWAALQVRKRRHTARTVRELARHYYEYAHTKLNYWSCREYRRLFSTLPISWSWEELAYMQASHKPRIRQLARIAQRVPLLTSLIRTFHVRVLMFRKASDIGNIISDSTLAIFLETDSRKIAAK